VVDHEVIMAEPSLESTCSLTSVYRDKRNDETIYRAGDYGQQVDCLMSVRSVQLTRFISICDCAGGANVFASKVPAGRPAR